MYNFIEDSVILHSFDEFDDKDKICLCTCVKNENDYLIE